MKTAPLRAPKTVMRLSRMGAFFPTRLSFMRSLIRRLDDERATVTRPVWQMDDNGFGRAVYSVTLGGQVYSLVAFSNDLDPANRTDRVIANEWDAAFVLFDGVPDQDDLVRLQKNAPKQEAGRFSDQDLVLARANKSVRFFEHVVDRLSRGQQPDKDLLMSTGYLMRTTAVYGNGKFGSADRGRISGRRALSGPFQAEMLTVWLIRGFSHDLAEHVAKARSFVQFVQFEPEIVQNLGVGNATGLGMAPFLVNHPVLLNTWIVARETALARVRRVENCSPLLRSKIGELLARARAHLDQWTVADETQMERIKVLRGELAEIANQVSDDWLARPLPFERLIGLTEHRSEECQELIVALVLEPNGALVDDLAQQMATSVDLALDPAMTVEAVRGIIDAEYGWAQAVDFNAKSAQQTFWYTSEAKLEPRIGNRFTEDGAEREMPLDIARRVQNLLADIEKSEAAQSVAAFLTAHPQHRHIVRRVQNAAAYPYSEIQDNLIDASIRPIDMLRCKLSFFGAAKFDPKSDLWTRINMFQGAPVFSDIGAGDCDDWWLPVFKGAT